MSRVFDLYHKKALIHEWNASTRRAKLVEADQGAVKNYNDIWQAAAEFIQNKIDTLPEGAPQSEKLYLDAVMGTLNDNRISAEDAENMDNKVLRQKIDGFIAKLSSMTDDSPDGDVSDYIKQFTSGMESFKSRVDVDDIPDPTAPPSADTPPGAPPPGEEGAPPPEGGEAAGAAGAPQGQEAPPPDENSPDTLLKDLNLNI